MLAALRRYAAAAEFFELCASAPVAGPTGGNAGGRGPSQGPMGMNLGGIGMGMGMGMGMGIGMGMGMGMGIGIGMGSSGNRYGNLGSSEPSVFQVEAAKKLLLVQLILHGKVRTCTVARETLGRRCIQDLASPEVHPPDGLQLEGYPIPLACQSLPKPRASPLDSGQREDLIRCSTRLAL